MSDIKEHLVCVLTDFLVFWLLSTQPFFIFEINTEWFCVANYWTWSFQVFIRISYILYSYSTCRLICDNYHKIVQTVVRSIENRYILRCKQSAATATILNTQHNNIYTGTMADSGRHFLIKDIVILYKVLIIFVVKSQLTW